MDQETAEPPDTTNLKLNYSLASLLTILKSDYFSPHLINNDIKKHLPRFHLTVHSKIEECFYLWEKFSQKDSLFQLWEFRYCWFLGYKYTPFFYTIYEKNKPLACLPLWYNSDEKRYEWFGGYWPEDNYFFVIDEKLIPLLLLVSPRPLFLNAILPEKIKEKNNYYQQDECKYILPIKGKKTIDEILSFIPKKHRHHLRYYYFQFLKYQPKIEIGNGDQSDKIHILKELSFLDHERKNISSYRDIRRIETFRQIYKNQGRYKILTAFVYVQNRPIVYDIIGVYKNNFYVLTGASDLYRFPGSGVFITYVELEKASQLNMDLIDYMQEDYNWKHKYCQKKPLLKIEIK